MSRHSIQLYTAICIEGKGLALSIQIINSLTRKGTSAKPAKVKSSSKIKPKPKKVKPFPISALKKVKNEPGSTSKGKQPAIIDEDDSCGPEILDNPLSVTKHGKCKAKDKGMVVVHKKPAPPTSTPAKGTTAHQQQSAAVLVNCLLEQTNPKHLKEMAEACHNASVTSSLLVTREGQITDLQHNIGALHDTKDAKIVDLQHDISTVRDSKDAVIAGLQHNMGKLCDHYDHEIHKLQNQHECDMRKTCD
ncbi:hypothetical protein FRC10_000945 [Ceratobasidium sp. 414]|nr:hypothetical protein FRC10_000945 [Ceratobasidium sp. 414]